GHQTGLSELAVTHNQQAALLVEVAVVEGDQLADADSAHAQEPDERLVGGGPQPGPQAGCRPHERADLSGGVQVWGGTVRPAADQPCWRDLVGGVDAVQVGGEAAYG